ncbi:MAG: hypothetical protein K0Q48_2231 [Bacillota bacterium]|jgi:hypothetical protein|nr:hypothetical protein [Bacillota bacterium]
MVCKHSTKFKSGDNVVSLAIHPPEIESGTKLTVISPHYGTLVAVKLPSGELHRWFADFELEPVNNRNGFIREGDFVIIKANKGHPPMIKEGMTVQAVRVLQTDFYDLSMEGMKYHRWLAGFELANIF